MGRAGGSWWGLCGLEAAAPDASGIAKISCWRLAFAPRSCAPLQGFSQGDGSLGPCQGGPTQGWLCWASSQTQGCVTDHGSSWGVGTPTLEGALGEQEGSYALRSLTIHITAKEKVQKLLISVLPVPLVHLGGCFYQRAGLGTVAENLVKAF